MSELRSEPPGLDGARPVVTAIITQYGGRLQPGPLTALLVPAQLSGHFN